MIEKNENDILFSTKRNKSHQEVTYVSMWITLWKLGISLPICGGFHKIMGKIMWKSRYTDFGLWKNRLIGSKIDGFIGSRNFCNCEEGMVE